MSVIYSILCHEHPDSVVDMIRNIFYYHPDISCTIVLNSSVAMHTALKTFVAEIPSVWIAEPSNKRMWTYDIYNGHITNFVFCRTNAIKAAYFIPLASNCMFHRPFTWSELSATLDAAPPPPTTTNLADWHWPDYFKNFKMVKGLSQKKITSYYSCQHEGSLVPYDTMAQIVDCTLETTPSSLIQRETTFEEILLPTLYSHFTGKKLMTMCKVFWDKPRYAPAISDIEAEALPCVKRVDRNYRNPVRTWLRERAHKYVMLPVS